MIVQNTFEKLAKLAELLYLQLPVVYDDVVRYLLTIYGHITMATLPWNIQLLYWYILLQLYLNRMPGSCCRKVSTRVFYFVSKTFHLSGSGNRRYDERLYKDLWLRIQHEISWFMKMPPVKLLNISYLCRSLSWVLIYVFWAVILQVT